MTLAIGGAKSGSLYSSGSDWIADTYTAIRNSQKSAGILGALQGANDGSLGSYLDQSTANANNLALISQSKVSSSGSFYAQIAQEKQKELAGKKLDQAFADLRRAQEMVQKKNVLDSFIYFTDGSSLDTNNNILTMPDGTQYDTTTGAKYLDPAFIIQMANGAYLDTKNNILTLSDGTRIDTVTGLKVFKTA